MKALQREMGDVEITEASVREYIAKMTPEQRLRLQNEGKDLKQELLTNTDHKEELQVFRKEVNAKAEAAGLPVEKVPPHHELRTMNSVFELGGELVITEREIKPGPVPVPVPEPGPGPGPEPEPTPAPVPSPQPLALTPTPTLTLTRCGPTLRTT